MEVNILKFGAVGDGVTMNTAAIQSAIAEAAAQGGGRVVVPAGRFLTGSIFLEDHIELHLEAGAVLVASENQDDYNDLDAYPQNSTSVREQWQGKHLILAIEKTNVAITGLGTICGSGSVFFEPHRRCKTLNYAWVDGFAKAKDPEAMRPGQMIVFVECRDVTVRDVTLEDSPCWTLFLHGCEYVSVSGLRIRNPIWNANTDGIDIDTCRFVTVSDCIIDTGDDAITLRCSARKLLHREPVCEHVTITNCVIGTSAVGIRFGVGAGEIRHIAVSNISIPRASVGFDLMTAYKNNGDVNISEVQINNVTAENVAFPIRFTQENNNTIRGVIISNYRVEAYCAAIMHADIPGNISDVVLKQIDITQRPQRYYQTLNETAAEERGKAVLDFEGAKELTLENVSLHVPEALKTEWPQLTSILKCDDLVKRNCNF
ncbi:MAG: right-handed parallel beta-helix repeat-containing protein [Oscillospiraceae bacterium]|nr:right-handed parallel beta-helix repeat-containing protein [Oscillospiraceae bacterium]